MAADYLKYASGNAASTTLSVAMSNSDTSCTITSDTNFATADGEGMVIIDEDQDTEEYAYATGKTSNTLTIPLVNRGLEGGSAQAHAINASIKGIFTAGMLNNMVDALCNVVLKTTGVLDTTKVVDLTTAQTLTNKNLTSATNTFPTSVVTLTGTQTLTNKRVTRRVVTVTQSATPTINTDNTDVAYITGLAQAITSFTTNLSGTPVNGNSLIISITDDGTGRAITWGASFESSGNVTLPTTTVASARLDIGFLYNTVTSKWRCIASA